VKLLIFIYLLSLACPAEGFAEQTLNWQDCVNQARADNPDLISAAEKYKETVADKGVTQSAALPQISSELTGKKSKASTSDKQADSYAYSVTGKQLLFDGFKTSNDIAAAKEDIRASNYDYAVVSSNIRLNLRTAFAELLRAQYYIFLTENILNQRKQNLDLVRLRYEAGREHRGALLAARADLAQAQLDVEQAKRDLLLAQTKLVKAIGWERIAPVKVEGEFAVSNPQREMPDFEYLADNTPFLKELIAKKDAVRFNLKSAKADFFPQVYLNSSIGNSSSSWPPEDNNWSAGLNLSFPLFEGGSRAAKVSKQKARLQQARAAQRSGRDSVIITLQETWTDLQYALDVVSVREKFLEAARERSRIGGSQYSIGLINFDDWIILEDNLVSAKKSYLNAQADVLIAEAQWVQAKGGTLEYAQE
ncbi:MAG: TolC family protein, partial [Candidatus Omnitrophica bacterium]|nr:TolC family protein [Candidatus Omnitrophota bacterium]